MRFLRHDGIYRSDVSLLLVNPVQLPPPDGRPRYRAIGRDGRSTPCPSSAMSSGRLFLNRVGRHQSPSPLHRHIQHKPLALRHAIIYHRTAGSVLTVCVSRGGKRRLLRGGFLSCDEPKVESCGSRTFRECSGRAKCTEARCNCWNSRLSPHSGMDGFSKAARTTKFYAKFRPTRGHGNNTCLKE